MNRTLNALDRVDYVSTCLEAVGDLMTPEPDLHAVNRDKQAVLLQFLMQELSSAREQLAASLRDPD